MISQLDTPSFEEYGIPLVFAVLLHVVAGVVFFGNFGWSSAPKRVDFEVPKSIQASLVQLEQVAPPAPAPVAQQPRATQPRPQPTPQPRPQPTPEPAPVEQPKPATPPPAPRPVEPKPAEPAVPATLQTPTKPAEVAVKPPEPQPAPVQPPQISEAELLDSFLAELEAEDRAIEQQLVALERTAQRNAQIASTVANHRQLITQQIQQRWSRPAELRLMDLSNIQAVVAVQLLPTGELASATIIEASGLATYDQSVLRAIERVRRFEVPTDPEMFEAGGFRRLTITFRPEDLM